jgi:serine/threonine protein kinase
MLNKLFPKKPTPEQGLYAVERIGSVATDAAEQEQLNEFVLTNKLLQGYSLGTEIGRGATSKIYSATHELTGTSLAIKVLHRSIAGDEEMINRFKKEAFISSKLSSPNTISVYDYGLLSDGRPYMVMEHITGQSAGDVIEGEGAISLQRALPIFIQIASGLSHAHSLGVMHRDVKPCNIMLVERGKTRDWVKLIDFGLAKRFLQNNDMELTRAGEVLGSPVYMSPEQCAGKKIDHRTDIYSMGCLMYEMLTGQPVFDADSPLAMMNKHVFDLPTELALRHSALEILPPLTLVRIQNIIFKALSKNVDGRHQTAQELQDELTQLYREIPVAPLL